MPAGPQNVCAMKAKREESPVNYRENVRLAEEFLAQLRLFLSRFHPTRRSVAVLRMAVRELNRVIRQYARSGQAG